MADENAPHDLRPREGNQQDEKADLIAISPTLAGESTIRGEATEESYAPEIRASSWRIERTVDREAIQEQLDAADEDAAKTNDVIDNNDPHYQPPKET